MSWRQARPSLGRARLRAHARHELWVERGAGGLLLAAGRRHGHARAAQRRHARAAHQRVGVPHPHDDLLPRMWKMCMRKT